MVEKVQISNRALTARINRLLKKESKKLVAVRKKGRTQHMVIDLKSVVETVPDIRKYAKYLGCLRVYEE